jgi:hypothetical protein
MNGREKSDSSIVPVKSPNKSGAEAREAEGVEGRELAKGNLDKGDMGRTQGRNQPMPNALDRIREVARRDGKQRFTALMHHVYEVKRLRTAYLSLRKEAAAGVDGVTWQQYGQDLEANLQDLSGRLARGGYRARPVRRVQIPKADGGQRPLGVPTLEDKIVQRSVVEVLGAIYEQDFLGFSYGFRAGRNQHQALDALTVGLTTRPVRAVLDADIRGFLMPSSYYPPSVCQWSKSPGRASGTLILRPLRRPRETCTAERSPRLTRCNTVWRETPRMRMASTVGT